MLNSIMLKIRRKETPFYEKIYNLAKFLRRFEMPVVKPLYYFLSFERIIRLTFWSNFTRIFYYTPILKLHCMTVGKGLNLIGGMPLIMGHLRLNVGDNVIIHGKSTFVGAKVFDNPTLTIGNNTCLGYGLLIDVGCDISIGNDVLVGGNVTIMSYDAHPSNPTERHLPAPKESSKPIVIKDNVWIGGNCIILKGVTIGEGSVVASGSVVTAKVPPNTLAFGNPARCYPLNIKV